MSRGQFQKVVMLVLCCLLVAGCSSAAKQEEKKNMSGSLKVLYGSKDFFFQKYGDLFTVNYPNIEIEVIETAALYNSGGDFNKAVEELIEQQKPDIISIFPETYEQYVNAGKLMEIDTLIKRDKYNVDTIYPTLMELLKEQGGGKLYGLSPYFSAGVVFYNKDLFAKYNLEVPRDGMTWQEIFDLAKRFPTDGDEDTRIYGYGSEYATTVNQLVTGIADTQGLTYVNPDTLKVTVNTDSWRNAYQLALDAVNSKSIHYPKVLDGMIDMETYFNNQMFLIGRAGMTTGHSYMLQSIEHAKSMLPDYKPFEIGIAAGPVDPAEPGKTRNINISDIFAINADASNVDAAWEFMKYVNGEEYAKAKSKNISYGLLSRVGYNTEVSGVDLEPFYKLSPKLNQNNARKDKIPDSFYTEFNPLVESEIAQVQEEKKSLDDALKAIEEQGQVFLDKAVQEKAQSGDAE